MAANDLPEVAQPFRWFHFACIFFWLGKYILQYTEADIFEPPLLEEYCSFKLFRKKVFSLVFSEMKYFACIRYISWFNERRERKHLGRG